MGTEPESVEESAAQKPQDENLGEGGKKALEAERKARATAEKDAAQLRARLKEIEDAQLSELDRARAHIDALQEANVKSTTEALRWRTAAKFGISDEDAETFLTGTDEETITMQAERLAGLISKPTTPRPDPSQGSSGRAKPQTTAEQFAAQLGDF